MICCQFIFAPGTYDADFHELDDNIAEFAKSLPGFIKNQTYYSDDKKISNAIYYFENMEAVKQLAQYPQHLTAKSQVDRWYNGYKIIISEVISEYGDGKLSFLK